jgi:Flp pilus assembly protein TadG
MTTIATRTRTSRRGAAAAEFAIVAPLLFLLILGIVEFGRLMMVQQTLINAVREGARKATLPGTTTSQVQSTVDTYLKNGGVNGADPASVSPDPSTAAAGDAMTVKVTVPFRSVSWLPNGMFLGDATLSASVVMRKEADTR